ncbi:uncharacterized protein K452DRAFT_338489 [Aplosporella prunicola CBS 121167]|uniref:RNase H type-1 domain-containing protein n=1 Tax=Aplosporella prunicola CBS 121167 TaxID=1176127 RepID=A0A6A6B598_9PEZI|nr:uncharacterized protein K452DRAFT_338489 [Aplosporella prunicola CBS 121167]KAF2138445.1 hypothetical protein K452DRAFT_338489 [Aplosporella prunicola CBS 121167]
MPCIDSGRSDAELRVQKRRVAGNTIREGRMTSRLYDPSLDYYTIDIPRSDLVVYNQEKQILQLQMKVNEKPEPYPDESTVVIYIDGACRGEGTREAEATYGLYVGLGSDYNRSGRPCTTDWTFVHEIKKNDSKITRVIYATDSIFLVRALTEWIEEWIANDGFDSDRNQVEHFDKLRDLRNRFNIMQQVDAGGFEIQLWHVPPEKNQDADALAHGALTTRPTLQSTS